MPISCADSSAQTCLPGLGVSRAAPNGEVVGAEGTLRPRSALSGDEVAGVRPGSRPPVVGGRTVIAPTQRAARIDSDSIRSRTLSGRPAAGAPAFRAAHRRRERATAVDLLDLRLPLAAHLVASGGRRGHDLAAVDHQGLAGDPGGLIGGEEGDGVADVARLADPAERRSEATSASWSFHSASDSRVRTSRGRGRSPGPAPAPGPAAGSDGSAPPGGVVDAELGADGHPAEGGGVDDRPAVLLFIQRRQAMPLHSAGARRSDWEKVFVKRPWSWSTTGP